MATIAKFTCRACHKVFVREQAYLDHECKQLKREKEIKTPIGQAALHYYSTWMRTKKRMPPPLNSFMTSNYYRTFMSFAEFVKKTNLLYPDKFIWLMCQRDYPPTMWLSEAVYSEYLLFIDTKMPPLEHAKTSIKTILDYADKHNLEDVSTVFEVINPNELIYLIRIRKLSPWFLLFSKKFGHMLMTRINNEQQMILETLIHPDKWEEKKVRYQEEIEQIKTYIREMGL